MAAEPRPCPICGATPAVGDHRHSDETGEQVLYAYVECRAGRTEIGGPEHFAGVHADTVEDALAVWNGRA